MFYRDKYRELSDDETDASSSYSVLKTSRRKGVVATGGKSKSTKITSRVSGSGRTDTTSGCKAKNNKKHKDDTIATE